MLTDIERRGLKAVVTLAVKEAGGQENCAGLGRIKRPAAFSDYGNRAVEDRHIPLDVAVEIDRFNSNGRLIRAAARLLGFLLIPMPRRDDRLTVVQAAVEVAKEGSEAIAAVAPYLSPDSRLPAPSASMRAHSLRQIDEAIEAMLNIRALLDPPQDDGGEQ